MVDLNNYKQNKKSNKKETTIKHYYYYHWLDGCMVNEVGTEGRGVVKLEEEGIADNEAGGIPSGL